MEENYHFPGSNSSNETQIQGSAPYALIPWGIFNAVIIVCGALGNILVIMAYRNPRMKTVTNLFIANLAFADLNVCLINAPFNILKMTLETWPFGLAICKIVTSLLGITLSASVGSLIAIAVDRYRAIVHPLKPRMRTRHAVYILIAIWISAFVVATPMLKFSEVRQGDGCIEPWPETDFPWHLAYFVFVFFTLYLIPLGTMSILYFMIYYNLTKNKPVQKSAQRARVSVVRMLIMVVIIFALCWLPFHVIFLYIEIKTIEQITLEDTYVALFSLWLTTANSSFNPIIYAVFNLNYRREFARILTCGAVNVGKYLGCETSVDGRSPLSHTTVRRSTTQLLSAAISLKKRRSSPSMVDEDASSMLVPESKARQVNGNAYDVISDDVIGASPERAPSEKKYGDPKAACFESVC